MSKTASLEEDGGAEFPISNCMYKHGSYICVYDLRAKVSNKKD